eukprot:TRINITY_DN33547_c0_g1_i1.p1 TRINITY_DN33547_c0_g1~~TRINITY_DN33547_c0_g1_i1.p1  ORF type:complete len:380 (-),score=88.01 TRINITY_DN33547_c0_g1_i1:140-1186(-)
MAKGRRMFAAALLFALGLFKSIDAQSIDGGRSELPGMRQDMFDQAQKQKKGAGKPQSKGPPPCKKSDLMSPFYSFAYGGSEIYVRLNSTQGPCERLISIGGANYSTMTNASRTCGPAGEWKRRIAENLSSVFFQGGWDWVVSENDTIEVTTETGTYDIQVNEEKYASQLECWKYGCECEQVKNPFARAVLIALLVIAIGGLGYDSVKVVYYKIVGKKPPKHVESKAGHKMIEVKLAERNYCDVCGNRGTTYQCSGGTNYDMCKKCYKEAKKKVKADWEAWCEKHPEDKKKSKKEKDDDEDERKASESERETKDGKDTDTESRKSEDTKKTDDADEAAETEKDEAAAEE